HRVALPQVGHMVSAQDPRDCPGRYPDLRAEHIGPLAVFSTGCQDLLLDLVAGLGRHRVRPRGPLVQPPFALSLVAVDPGLAALAGRRHRGSDVVRLPTSPVTVDDQTPTRDGQAGIPVGHEASLWWFSLRPATPHPEAPPRPTRPDECYQPPDRVH